MLDLEKLRLTDEELMEGTWYLYGEYPDGYKKIADEQLAKALWGLVGEWGHSSMEMSDFTQELKCALEAAGIARPEPSPRNRDS